MHFFLITLMHSVIKKVEPCQTFLDFFPGRLIIFRYFVDFVDELSILLHSRYDTRLFIDPLHCLIIVTNSFKIISIDIPKD